MKALSNKYYQYNLLDTKKLDYNYIKKCLQAIGKINGKYFENSELLNYNWLNKNQKYKYYNPLYIVALNQCNKEICESGFGDFSGSHFFSSMATIFCGLTLFRGINIV